MFVVGMSQWTKVVWFQWESKISVVQQIKMKQVPYQVIYGFRKTNRIHASFFCLHWFGV